MLSEDEILVKLHEAEALLQEHGVEILDSYFSGYNSINIKLSDDYSFYKNIGHSYQWCLINNDLNQYTIGDLDELIMIWKNRQ